MTRKDILEGIVCGLLCAVGAGWCLFCGIVIAHFIMKYW